MSDIRQHALNLEAKKHAYRQTQDGIVISFVVHPNDMVDGLAIAPLGTRYILALVEIGDDELPTAQEVRGVLKDKPQNRLTQQAVMACKEPRFWKFLEEDSAWFATSELLARDFVCQHCAVKSRSDILPGTPAAEAWTKLYDRYQLWLRPQ